jgi:hypothetical protein
VFVSVSVLREAKEREGARSASAKRGKRREDEMDIVQI